VKSQDKFGYIFFHHHSSVKVDSKIDICGRY